MSDSTVQLQQSAKEKLKSIVAKIEGLEDQKTEIQAEIKDVYADAKAQGYDAKVLRKLIALRKVDKRTREEQEQILDLYLHALGEV